MAAIDLARINLRREGGPLNVIDLAGINFAGRRQPMAPFLSEFTFAPVPSDAVDGLAIIDKIRGKSLVWNQLVQNGDFSDGFNNWTASNVTVTDGDDEIEIQPTTESYNANNLWQTLSTISGHKYLLCFEYKCTGTGVVYFADSSAPVRCDLATTFTEVKTIIASTGYERLRFYPSVSQYSQSTILTLKKRIIVIDLTLLFGSGYEPATVEEFEALYDLDYYVNNAGQIISNKTEAIEVVGFNQWDEEWELGGFRTTTGEPVSDFTNRIRSKNFIKLKKGTTYYFRGGLIVFEYDSEKNFIKYHTKTNNTFLFDNDCSFIKISTNPSVSVVTTYNHDICINISSSRNGEYEPYHKTTVPLNIPTITGKLNGEGESVVVFPQGMRSDYSSNVYDEAFGNRGIVKLSEVDLGDLNWVMGSGTTYSRFTVELTTMKSQSTMVLLPNVVCEKYTICKYSDGTGNTLDKVLTCAGQYLAVVDSAYTDATTFKAAMAGVKLIYELATPLEYVLDEPLPKKFRSYQGGTMKQLPENGSEPTTAPMVLEASWPVTD